VVLLAAAALALAACDATPTQGGTAPTMQASAGQDTAAAQTAQPAEQTTREPSLSSTAGGVSLGKAREIALAAAGCSAAQATFTKAGQVDDGGIAKYEIGFVADGWEYEYDIHAGTGIILDSGRKRVSSTQPPVPSTTEPPPPTSVPGEIGMKKAREIALEDAGFSADQVLFLKTWRVKERGVAKYEIEFVKGSKLYEYDIHAGTGVILKAKTKSAELLGFYFHARRFGRSLS